MHFSHVAFPTSNIKPFLSALNGLLQQILRISKLFLFVCMPFFWASIATSAELKLSVSQTPLSLPFYIAENQGYFTDEGLQLKITDVIGGHRTMQNLQAGTADLATSSEAVVMFNGFEHNNFAVIATFVTSSNDSKIVVRGDSGITRPRDLAGKRIGTVVGGSCHYYLDTVLLFDGIDPKTVHLQNLQPETMADALKNGDVDAIAIWEPFPFKAIKSVPGARALSKSNAYRTTFNLIAHKKVLGVRDDELVKLLRALDRAEQFIAAQPQKAKAILLERLKLDRTFIDWFWSSYMYRLTLDQALLATLEGEARWARQEKMVKGKKSPNYLTFVYPGPLTKVRSNAVTIIR